MPEDKISESLGLEPLEGELVETPNKELITPPESVEDDYQYARDNFYNVIEKGTHALEQMLDVARASEHPRAYEVVSTLMKTLVDANKDLVSMSEKKVKDQNKEEAQNVTNNNLFVGSTAELQKMLKEMRDNDGTN